LKQQIPSNASTSELKLQREHDRLRQEMKEQVVSSRQQLVQKKAKNQRQHTELMEVLKVDNDRQKQEVKQKVDQLKGQNKELMDRLKELMGFLKQQNSSNE